MWSLRKSIWIRFAIIVILQSVLTMGAVYYITFSNFKKSIKWDLNRLETLVIEEWQGKKNFASIDEKLQFINNDEWNNFSFVLRRGGEVLASYGKEGYQPESLRNYDIETDWKNYKSFVFEQQHSVDGLTVYTRALVKLDLIDDTLWIFAICLPLILLPVFYFGVKVSRQVVNPMRKIAGTLALVEEGNLDARIEKSSSNKEVSRLIKRLNNTLAKLQVSFDQAQRFNANAAHELKTPLAVMRGEIEVCLQKKRNEEEYQECLENCLEETVYLNSIIETLLMISRPGAADNLDFEEKDVSAALEACLEIIDLLAGEKNIKVTGNISSVKLKCVPSLLKRCMMNLLENAVKYSPEDSQINVSLNSGSEYLVFTVEDSAPKIAAKEYQKIFEPFYQQDSGSKGSGLGLALVRWVADIHAGEVCLSAAEEGNIFTLKFPLKK